MSDFLADYGVGKHSRGLLRGGYTTFGEIPQEVACWLKYMVQSSKERGLPPVLGEISKEEFQNMFKAPDERTSSHPEDLNYSIWKAMAKSEYLSSFLCILISLPFIYGFANEIWLNQIDVMLEK